MSFHRENVIWQSPDGTWSRGFYDYFERGDGDDFDPEWDVEYTGDLRWVSTGHPTEEAADASWRGPNPAGRHLYPYTPDTAADIAALDDRAAQVFDAVAEPDVYGWELNQHPYAEGPRKERDPVLLAKQLTELQRRAHYHRLNGYANLPDRRIPSLAERLDAMALTPQQRAAVAEVYAAHAAELRQLLEGARYATTEDRESVLADIERARRATTPERPSGDAPARAKTTARSTRGSFAPKTHSDPEVTLDNA